MGASDVKGALSGPFHTESPAATQRIAAIFARQCSPNDVVGLKGSLGAGKTCFVKGMARGLGVEPIHQVTSPTFVLHKQYRGHLMLHHFDAYRLERAESMIELGCDEIFTSEGISVIEWADHVIESLPDSHFMWDFHITGRQERELTLVAKGTNPEKRVPSIEAALEERR